MTEILQLSFLIALFCVSWDILLTYSPGEPKRNQMLLYWFRKQIYDHEEYHRADAQDKNNLINKEYTAKLGQAINADNLPGIGNNMLSLLRDLDIEKIDKDLEAKLSYQFYLKPILLCKYCFPSFYGTIIFIMLKGFHVELWKEWLLSIVCSVIMVGIISGVHEKLTR